MFDDTIAAIATPLGEGGLAVVRLSGPQALAVADKSFLPIGKNSLKPSVATSHTIHYGKIVRRNPGAPASGRLGGAQSEDACRQGCRRSQAGTEDFQVVDEVLLAVLRAPRTFTREDTVEITCHGGILPAKLVLDTLLENGARPAEPGEFTRRAFLNGRLDLAQAEAVADLIHSRTELALAAANEQLAGKLSQRINELRDDLMHTLAHVEAHIDFPDEDIAPDTKAQLLERLEDGEKFVDELLRTANEGQILRRGIRAAIVGRPNVGKSSLLNQLLGRDRAIVSPIPGTTRDTIEETANIRGLPVVFIDTAGLREARDEIEQEGIRRSRESLARSEFILHVLDASEPLTNEDEKYLAGFAAKKRILVRNKIDLPVKLALPSERGSPEPQRAGNIGSAAAGDSRAPIVDVCCLSGQGIEPLKDAIKKLIWSGEIRAEMLQVMINSRHQDALNRARAAIQRTIDALRADATLELVAMDLRSAVNSVGEIVGKTATEDLLDSIFSQFCIGK
jgi:tRNA modification GTPase